jgi:lipopolysaccharide/colanic/teichoic acid biosynthesis glycosyltransferase
VPPRYLAVGHTLPESAGASTPNRDASTIAWADTSTVIGLGNEPGCERHSRVSAGVIRALDLGIAGLALLILSPLMALIALLVRVSSPGPILFRQVRVGHQGQPFAMLNFRSMYVGCDDKIHRELVTRLLTAEDTAPNGLAGVFKLDNDPRITGIGRFLRRTSLNELPQLLNVLRGDMSLVGPRPALPWEVELYQEHHRLRLQVKPGMTGLWQVRGRSLLSMEQALDLNYRLRPAPDP